MQQHCLFWDRDNDGIIYPSDTYIGFRELGYNIIFSFLALLIIHINFSYPTRLAFSYIPDPFFRLYIKSIHKCKHGSDSSTYDPEGRFIPQSFENMFSKYDKDHDNALTLSELFNMMKGHRCAADPYGVRFWPYLCVTQRLANTKYPNLTVGCRIFRMGYNLALNTKGW